MRNYRITSFFTFTTLFFVIEVIFALAFWTFLSAIYNSSQPKIEDQSHAVLIRQNKNRAKLTSEEIKREDEYDDEYDDRVEQHTIIHARERDLIKKEEEEDDDSIQGSSQTFPAFPQRRRKYSSTSSTSTPRSWPRSRSLSASSTPVRIKKEKEEEGEDQSTYDTEAGRSTASSSGRDTDSGVWSWRLERGLDAQRRHEAARKRKS